MPNQSITWNTVYLKVQGRVVFVTEQTHLDYSQPSSILPEKGGSTKTNHWTIINYVLQIISSLLHCTHTIACTWFKYYHHHHHQSYYWHGYVTFSNPDTNASWPIFFKDLNTWMLSERKVCEKHVHVHYAQCILKSYVHKIKHMYVALILVSGWLDGWTVTKYMYSTSSVAIYTSYTHKVTPFISFAFWCHSFLSLLQRP